MSAVGELRAFLSVFPDHAPLAFGEGVTVARDEAGLGVMVENDCTNDDPNAELVADIKSAVENLEDAVYYSQRTNS